MSKSCTVVPGTVVVVKVSDWDQSLSCQLQTDEVACRRRRYRLLAQLFKYNFKRDFGKNTQKVIVLWNSYINKNVIKQLW